MFHHWASNFGCNMFPQFKKFCCICLFYFTMLTDHESTDEQVQPQSQPVTNQPEPSTSTSTSKLQTLLDQTSCVISKSRAVKRGISIAFIIYTRIILKIDGYLCALVEFVQI